MAAVTKNRTYGKIAGFWVIVNNIRNLTCGKNDQYSKIYLPCNFEVNLITHLGVIAIFSSKF
jgi:E3 ubiquitin-protein ligase DOA10